MHGGQAAFGRAEHMAGRAARTGLILLSICGAVLVWELFVPGVMVVLRPELPEFVLYAVDKLGFAVALALLLTMRRLWRRCGFAGGVPTGALGLLWPLWLITALSALQGFAEPEPGPLFGWFAISAAVGFGEEGVFRGLIIAALGPDRPRRAVVVSSLLFGVLHLAGLLAPVDYRYILAQAVAAGCLGLVLGSVRLLAGSIWPGIIAHTALDFFGLAAAGSVSNAMDFSVGTLVVVLGSGAISFGWGIVLWRQLPRAD
jgi:membrane protease YdiL (CAAX protease family)